MDGVSKFSLPNGLRVVHHYDPDTAMVAVNVLYDVGSRDEKSELTGMAHLFEHLMFGGSVNVPNFDREIEDAGGVNNAWTSNDLTNFYDLLPAQNVETAFHLESDRMLALSFSKHALEVQRSVVVEEFKQQCLNQPYGDAMHYLRELFYAPEHPYSWPVIGKKPEHIMAVTDEDVRRWFYAHYAPNNAVMAVAGNVTPERVKHLAHKWFGDIPRRKIAERRIPSFVPLESERRVTVHGAVPQTCIFMAYAMDGYGARGYFVADAITDVLSAGRSSRFFTQLVMQSGLFTDADAAIVGSEHDGMVLITARLADESEETVERAIEAIKQQLRALATDKPVTDYEMQRAINRFESTQMFANLTCVSRAQNMALAELHGEDLDDAVARYRTITADEMTATARRLFVDGHAAIVVYRPEAVSEESAAEGDETCAASDEGSEGSCAVSDEAVAPPN